MDDLLAEMPGNSLVMDQAVKASDECIVKFDFQDSGFKVVPKLTLFSACIFRPYSEIFGNFFPVAITPCTLTSPSPIIFCSEKNEKIPAFTLTLSL